MTTNPPLRKSNISLDIIVPVFNEEESVPVLFQRLEQTFSQENLARHRLTRVRYLFIDDGSKDTTVEALRRQNFRSNRAKIVSFSRNFGHQAAVSAGIFLADSDVVAIIDADLQDPPEIIPEMIKLWREGYDVVYGQRKTRQEGAFKNACFKIFYRILSWMSPVEIAVDSGDFCIMGRTVVQAINSLPEKLRFLRGLRSWVGFAQTGFEYDRPRRELGKSKYTFRRLYRLATDGIASLSLVPLKIAQLSAFILFVFLAVIFFAARFHVIGHGLQDTMVLLLYSILISNCVILFC
jgi:dolichol-phosphate mannosyltransferase